MKSEVVYRKYQDKGWKQIAEETTNGIERAMTILIQEETVAEVFVTHLATMQRLTVRRDWRDGETERSFSVIL